MRISRSLERRGSRRAAPKSLEFLTFHEEVPPVASNDRFRWEDAPPVSRLVRKKGSSGMREELTSTPGAFQRAPGFSNGTTR